MISPWYRSRLFWFGLAGLLLLLVGWGAPPRGYAAVEFDFHRYTIVISKSNSAINASYNGHEFRNPTLAHPAPWRVHSAKSPSGVYPKIFGAAISTGEGPMGSSISIGLWFIVALYAVAWLGVMGWWRRRRHRLMNAPFG